MALTKNAAIRYKILDECLGNPGKRFTFLDLKETINQALVEINPQWGGISDRQLRYDLKYLEEYYNAPVTMLIEGRKRFYLYENQSHFSIFNNPLTKSEKDHLEQAILSLMQFSNRPGFEWLSNLGPIFKDKINSAQVKSVIEYESNIDYLGNNLVSEIFSAILNKVVLSFDYKPFVGGKIPVICHPYFLKQYNGRWYVFGRHEHRNNNQWHFPLDRIENLTVSYDYKYQSDTTEDWQDYFYDIIGVTRFDEKVEKIILHVNQEMAPYIQTKPLHPTQKLKKINEYTYEVEIKVIPNLELNSLLLSFGKSLVVQEPLSLKEKLRDIVSKMNENYQTK
jgi:predicted DNA-binding transcriptional regulator YafY